VSLRRAPLIVLGVVIFLVISFGVTRWLTRENRERDAVLHVLSAQARGDDAAMLSLIPGCAASPRCRAQVASNARRLRRTGEVKILTYDSGTKYALGDATGTVRVAWDIGTSGDTVVQCVTVHRGGAAFLGGSVDLRAISAPIALEGSCPG
jgi:hypothetical protein